jgi:hypothetical protein
MSQKLEASGWLTVGFTLVVAIWAATAQAQPLITCNNAGAGNGPITTFDFVGGAVVGSFLPTGAFDGNNGRGVEVLGSLVYYTELSDGSGPTPSIELAPFSGGAGGADIGTLPNPRPGFGIQDLAYSNGVLYALTGYPSGALEVFGLNPVTGAVVSGPVSISSPAMSSSDGFTVLPNGNFLINEGDPVNVYDQYNSTTGAVIPGTTIVAPGNPFASGVDTDGTSLFFHTASDVAFTSNSLAQTTLTGAPIATQGIPADSCEDISVIQSVCLGAPGATPGMPNCHGRCVSFLAKTFGGIDQTSSDFGYASVTDLQNAIKEFCGN